MAQGFGSAEVPWLLRAGKRKMKEVLGTKASPMQEGPVLTRTTTAAGISGWGDSAPSPPRWREIEAQGTMVGQEEHTHPHIKSTGPGSTGIALLPACPCPRRGLCFTRAIFTLLPP